jgi:hypothetical protein
MGCNGPFDATEVMAADAICWRMQQKAMPMFNINIAPICVRPGTKLTIASLTRDTTKGCSPASESVHTQRLAIININPDSHLLVSCIPDYNQAITSKRWQ